MFSLTPTAVQVYQKAGEDLAKDFKTFTQQDYQYHFGRSQEEITKATVGVGQRAIILCAGALNDIPVESLAKKFDHITLVDITPLATEAALSRFPETAKRKFTIITADLTGIIGELSTKVEKIARECPYDQFAVKVMQLLPTLKRHDFDPQFKASFICSNMNASQLGALVTHYIDQVAMDKYKKPFVVPKEQENQMAQFILEIQKKHIDDLHRIVDEKGKVYFADHFSAKNIINFSHMYNEESHAGDQIPFPGVVEIQAHLKERFNEVKQETWPWSLTVTENTFGIINRLGGQVMEVIDVKKESITEYCVTSLTLTKK